MEFMTTPYLGIAKNKDKMYREKSDESNAARLK